MVGSKKSSIAEDVFAASTDTCTVPLDHFPPLITYICLGDGITALAKAAETALQTGDSWLGSVALTMPRKGAGPRPVTVLSPVARTVYGTLVSRLASSLPVESRAPGAWASHRGFGRSGEHTHVVELDYASCYETIDHDALNRELILRSMEPPLASMLTDFLAKVEGARGLPQMLAASDRLADAYLSMVDRRIQRDGFVLNRYADDTRILAKSWEEANAILEGAAVYAREFGLILAGAKTGIRRTSSVDESERAIEDYVIGHLEAAEVDLTEVVEIPSSYGSPDFAVIAPEEAEKIAAAGTNILGEWAQRMSQSPHPSVAAAGAASAGEGQPANGVRDEESEPGDGTSLPAGMLSALGRAIQWASQSLEPLSPQLLEDLVFHYPLRLEDVCRYLVLRRPIDADEGATSWENLGRLIAMGRQSPWAKLWLLHTALEVRPSSPTAEDNVLAWVLAQVDDDNEVVRAQAAWTAAMWGFLPADRLSNLYRDATSVTQPAITACATKQAGISAEVVKAMRGDSHLNEAAHKWAL